MEIIEEKNQEKKYGDKNNTDSPNNNLRILRKQHRFKNHIEWAKKQNSTGMKKFK